MSKLKPAIDYFIRHIKELYNENGVNDFPPALLNDRKQLLKIAHEVLEDGDYHTLDIGCIVVLPGGKVYDVLDIDGYEGAWVIKNRDNNRKIAGAIEEEFSFYSVDYYRLDEITYKFLKNN